MFGYHGIFHLLVLIACGAVRCAAMPTSSRVALFVSLRLASLLLCAHSLAFDFVTDDARSSSFVYENLVEHGALVFNLGRRVEGYTNFLWTILIALGLFLKIPAELSSRVLGTLCAITGTILFCAKVFRRLRSWIQFFVARSVAVGPVPAWIWRGFPGGRGGDAAVYAALVRCRSAGI